MPTPRTKPWEAVKRETESIINNADPINLIFASGLNPTIGLFIELYFQLHSLGFKRGFAGNMFHQIILERKQKHI